MVVGTPIRAEPSDAGAKQNNRQPDEDEDLSERGFRSSGIWPVALDRAANHHNGETDGCYDQVPLKQPLRVSP